MNRNSKLLKTISATLLVTMVAELGLPLRAFALTSGPAQPEFQSFEPVGTTDMVNPFSGDFTYNVPLLDVEGYPVNIAYHSGISVEQEASWVGLGWSLNTGAINRGIRGLPDDFNGEKLEKVIDINSENTDQLNIQLGAEAFGFVGATVNAGLNYSNYTGVSASVGEEVSLKMGAKGGGMALNCGIGFSTDRGVDLNANVGVYGGATGTINAAVNGNFGVGLNSREGLKYTSFGVNPALSSGKFDPLGNISSVVSQLGISNTFVPISFQSFVPTITNSYSVASELFRVRIGVSAYGGYFHAGGTLSRNTTRFDKNGTRSGYGYQYLQNADLNSVTDFTRDRDGRFNPDMAYLAAGNMTYDVLSVSGQGTAGMYRAFRNDIGSVFDPATTTKSEATSKSLEFGYGNLFEAGYDQSDASTYGKSGAWTDFKKPFTKGKKGSLYEPVYLKQAGDLAESRTDYHTAISQRRPLDRRDVDLLESDPLKNIPEAKKRAKRSTVLYGFTGTEAALQGVSNSPAIISYPNPGVFTTPETLSRVGTNRPAHHISEYHQVLPDGRRYVYGIPAMNNKQVEYTTSCTPNGLPNGQVNVSSLKPYTTNGTNSIGQQLYMKSVLPPHAHSYLLTEILSEDYADLTGDGLTPDDVGNYTKFNYTRTAVNYNWRTPYETGFASYDQGVLSDCHDDKGSIVCGQKEIWVLHSIETKNQLAFFYSSGRTDSRGSNDNVDGNQGGDQNGNVKLDRIELFNRSEWTSNSSAVPIKTVNFYYDYSLCHNTPNSNDPGKGKLTLRAIAMKYGNSDIGLLNPYKFEYAGPNPEYTFLARDRWGTYKSPSDNTGNSFGIALDNNQFPFTPQDNGKADFNAAAWNLTDIELPSGGQIHVNYEADDYAYVQNLRAMEMVPLAGLGSSAKFRPGSALYQTGTDPNLFLYFKRKKNGDGYDELSSNAFKSYLDNGDILQYNFRVQIDGENKHLASCSNTPLEDQVKGYGKVRNVGVCSDNADYAYVELEPKTVRQMPMLSGSNLRVHPATLAAIFYARLYNNKALKPSSEILTIDGATILKELIGTIKEITDYFQDPIVRYLAESKAKRVNLSQSWLRLCSQGKKKGGGHRVRRIEFSDNWQQVGNANQADATYGSEYEYTTTDEQGRPISSGVATYEPLIGGDENPFKMPASVDRTQQASDFPAVTPAEITNEGPMGETLYPSGQVGYSKVTIRSIHKNEGQSSQAVQTHEFYTAKDFPIRLQESAIQKQHTLPSASEILNKNELFEGSQGYTFTFNDMHGKPKKEAVLVSRGGDLQEVSHKIYRYGAQNGVLDNQVTCVNPATLEQTTKTLGEEIDLMIDTRAREEYSSNEGFAANLNAFIIGIIPIPIPTVFPEIPRSDQKKFRSMVATKIVQQYGILKEVETFDKGATITLSNEIYDLSTGQPIVTKVSTEHKDYEYQVKYPAYWAYKGMGAAYENIGYEEDITGNIKDHKIYIPTTAATKFKVGDEALLQISSSCNQLGFGNQTQKIWISNISSDIPGDILIDEDQLSYRLNKGICECVPNTSNPINYFAFHFCYNHRQNAEEFNVINSAVNKGDAATDYTCNIPREAVPAYDSLFQAGNSPYVLSTNGVMQAFFPKVYALLWGNSKSPIEAIYADDAGNGTTAIRSIDVNVGGNKLRIQYPIFDLYWGHYAPGRVARYDRSYHGTIGDLKKYKGAYPGYPIIRQSKKLLKITVETYSDMKCYMKAGANDSVLLYAYSDTASPSNNYFNPTTYGVAVYYLPYDERAPSNVSSATVEELNSPVFVVKAESNPADYRFNETIFRVGPLGRPSQTPITFNDILPITQNGKTYNSVIEWEKTYMKCRAEVVDRASQALTITALTRKIGSSSLNNGGTLPANGQFSGTLKVIRSGNRNQLLESAQDVSIVSKQLFQYKQVNSNTLNLGDVIRIQARTYTDTTAGAYATNSDTSSYYNPFVTGQRGTFRPKTIWEYTGIRNYDAAQADVKKGLLSNVPSFWQISALTWSSTVGSLLPTFAQGWFARETIRSYSPYGQPLEVTDAAGNQAASLYGYDNTLPIATVQNAQWNSALYENFEDNKPINPVLKFYQNTFSQEAQSNATITHTPDPHTGRYSAAISTNLSIPIPALRYPPSDYPSGAIYPFYFRPGQRYLLNYWQKMDINSPNAGLPGKISVSGTGVNVTTKAKTPVIDGWVLYEAQFTVPQFPTGNTLTLVAAPGTFDDLRILPTDANMKCYVYHPQNRRVMASLDENHMASFFEYDAEGKLTRVKKETDRGILTLKESRHSVQGATPSASGSQTTNIFQIIH